MKFRDPGTEEEFQINLAPLIDVVFLLLIFFMVSTTFSHESQLRIKLPEATTTEEPVEEPKNIEINISAEGLYSVRGPSDREARSLLNDERDTLLRALRDSSAGSTDHVVVIRADRKTPHEAVVRAMDAARRLGLTRITFATQQPPPEPGS